MVEISRDRAFARNIATEHGEASLQYSVARIYGRPDETLRNGRVHTWYYFGDRVAFGQRLSVIEAMKMEHTLRAPFAAVVKELPVSSGAQVVEGAPIMVLEPIEPVETSSA